jgi:DNA-binding transcriptional LysR family regulator
MVLLCRADDPLAARPAVPWSVFAQRPFIASAPRSSIRPITDAVLMQKRLALRPALEYPSVTACGALVAAGLGITALPRLALGLVSMEGLAAVPLVRPQASRAIGIVTRIGRTLPPVGRAFVATLLSSTGRRGADLRGRRPGAVRVPSGRT